MRWPCERQSSLVRPAWRSVASSLLACWTSGLFDIERAQVVRSSRGTWQGTLTRVQARSFGAGSLHAVNSTARPGSAVGSRLPPNRRGLSRRRLHVREESLDSGKSLIQAAPSEEAAVESRRRAGSGRFRGELRTPIDQSRDWAAWRPCDGGRPSGRRSWSCGLAEPPIDIVYTSGSPRGRGIRDRRSSHEGQHGGWRSSGMPRR